MFFSPLPPIAGPLTPKEKIRDTTILQQLLPGSEGWLLEADNGYCLVQEITLNGYCLICCHADIQLSCSLRCKLSEKCFVLTYIIQATGQMTIDKLPSQANPEGFHYLACFRPCDCTWHFRRGRYLLLLLMIPPAKLPGMGRYFPELVSAMMGYVDKKRHSAIINHASYPITGEAKRCISQLLECRLPDGQAPAFYGIKSRELFFEFNRYFISEIPSVQPATAQQEDLRLLGQVTDFMVQRMHKPLSMQQVMAAFNISEYRLKKIFRMAGQSFNAYLTDQRMRRAYFLLQYTDRKIAAVARETGYTSPSRFTDMFSKHYGIKPSMLRQSSPDRDTDSPDRDTES